MLKIKTFLVKIQGFLYVQFGMYKYSIWIRNEHGATYNIIMDNKPQIIYCK